MKTKSNFTHYLQNRKEKIDRIKSNLDEINQKAENSYRQPAENGVIIADFWSRAEESRKALVGAWKLTGYQLEDTDYIERFVENNLKPYSIENGKFNIMMEFFEQVCWKISMVSGKMRNQERSFNYLWVEKILYTYHVPEPGLIRFEPRDGVTYQLIYQNHTYVKEEIPTEPILMQFSNNGNYLALHHTADKEHMRLRKLKSEHRHILKNVGVNNLETLIREIEEHYDNLQVMNSPQQYDMATSNDANVCDMEPVD